MRAQAVAQTSNVISTWLKPDGMDTDFSFIQMVRRMCQQTGYSPPLATAKSEHKTQIPHVNACLPECNYKPLPCIS